MNCDCNKCQKIFADFTFIDFIKANPPKEKGVYVIRVKQKSEAKAMAKMIAKCNKLLDIIDWEVLTKQVRTYRLKHALESKCDILYIGQAGGNKDSENSLNKRFKALATSHTIMYPIWILLLSKWVLEYGYKIVDDPKTEEKVLQDLYEVKHNELPALLFDKKRKKNNGR